MFVLFSIFYLQTSHSHSWVHCVDYDTNSQNDLNYWNEAKCKGLPRNLFKTTHNAIPQHHRFGFDRGFNTQVRGDGSGPRCQGDASLGLDRNYGSRSNVVTYQKGRTYRLAWPAKNHAAATCTNRFIPDTALELFAFRQSNEANLINPSQRQFNRKPMPSSWSSDPHVRGRIDFKGFQNCPKFCENMDKALCHGTFTIPDNLQPGLYTFQWNWEFNANLHVGKHL